MRVDPRVGPAHGLHGWPLAEVEAPPSHLACCGAFRGWNSAAGAQSRCAAGQAVHGSRLHPQTGVANPPPVPCDCLDAFARALAALRRWGLRDLAACLAGFRR